MRDDVSPQSNFEGYYTFQSAFSEIRSICLKYPPMTQAAFSRALRWYKLQSGLPKLTYARLEAQCESDDLRPEPSE